MIDLSHRLQCMSNDVLHLILLPTEACNFRCRYCYEQFLHKRMPAEVVTGIRNLLARRAPGLRTLTLSWFGGEPLLAPDIIETVLTHVATLRQETTGIAFRSDATTNGYLLTPSMLERLSRLGVREYQVSFDGPREQHDRKRVLHGGKGTFDRIWSNLSQARQVAGDFTIVLRVHVDRENESSIPALLRQVQDTFGADGRFELFIRGLSRLGGPNDDALAVFTPEEGKRAVERLRSMADHMGLRQIAYRGEDSICYAAHANSFVIRSNGRVNKCTVALEDPANQVGMLHEDGTMSLNRPRMLGWMRGLRSGDRAELGCPMKGLVARKAPSMTLTPAGAAS